LNETQSYKEQKSSIQLNHQSVLLSLQIFLRYGRKQESVREYGENLLP